MIDPRVEPPISFREASKLSWLRSSHGKKRINVRTLHRWAHVGRGEIRLETIKIGAGRFTSEAALLRFVLLCAAADSSPESSPSLAFKVEARMKRIAFADATLGQRASEVKRKKQLGGSSWRARHPKQKGNKMNSNSPPVARQPAASPPIPLQVPRVVAKIGTAPPVEILAAAVNPQSIIDLQQACSNGGSLALKFFELSRWPKEARWMLFQFLLPLGGGYRVCVGKTYFPDVFAAAVASISGAGGATERTSEIEAAVEAAAIFHRAIPEVPADIISRRLKEVGGGNISTHKLSMLIKALTDSSAIADDDSATKKADPKAVALAFLAQLEPTSG